MTGRYAVWHPTDGGGFMHCPISGDQIRGSRKRMRQYAKDMNFMCRFIRIKGVPVAGYVCRPVPT